MNCSKRTGVFSIIIALLLSITNAHAEETLIGFVAAVSRMNSADGRYWSRIVLSNSPSDPAAYFVADQINSQECGYQSLLALKIDASTNKVDKDLLALAIAAKLTKERVWVTVSGCNSNNIPIVESIIY